MGAGGAAGVADGLVGTLTDPKWATEPDTAYEAAAIASGIPGALVDPLSVQPEMIGPLDHEAKQRLPNCTRCTGCSTVLTDMHAAPVVAEGLEGLAFMHGKGATNGWLFFGKVAGGTRRFIVKVGRRGTAAASYSGSSSSRGSSSRLNRWMALWA